jgi:DnaB-like helicase C terminal domain
MSDFNFGSSEFKSFADRVHGERAARLEQAPRILKFGVGFLDLALGGIFANDLVLIGAATGAGKTALASRIGIVNAAKGKRVHYFALEAEKDEIERRMKYCLVADMVRKYSLGSYKRLSYLDWYMGALDYITGPYEAKADKVLAEQFKTLHTFYRSGDFYAEQFEKMMLAIQDQTDLVILDHLHYVDSEDSNENRGYKLIVKKIRDTALSIGKPVVVVAHVRKADRKSTQLVPGIEDFHGTSDIPKIATKAIMLAPAFDQPSDDPCLWPTYLSPAKCRFDGTRTRYVGLTMFDVRNGTYNEDFDLGRINGGKFEIVDNSKTPSWAQVNS